MSVHPVHALQLWWAGMGLCGICACDVVSPAEAHAVPRRQKPTVDHVYARGPKPADLPRIAALRAIDKDRRRLVIAHDRCNSRKGNRAPTGCEVIFLMAVNARLRGQAKEVSSSKRTAARKARRQRAKEAAERLRVMQEELA